MIWPHTLRDVIHAKHLRHPDFDGAARRVNTASICVEGSHYSMTRAHGLLCKYSLKGFCVYVNALCNVRIF